MFRKLLNFIRPQKGSPEKSIENSSSFIGERLYERTKVARSRAPVGRGRPFRKRPNRPLPDLPGIYRFTNKKTGKVDYLGVAKSIRDRYRAHTKTRFMEHHFDYQTAKGDPNARALYDYEKIKIKEHQPGLNKNGGGGGRPWTHSPPAVDMVIE